MNSIPFNFWFTNHFIFFGFLPFFTRFHFLLFLFFFLYRYDLELDCHFDSLLGRHSRKPWSKYVNQDNAHLVTEESLDFLDKLLQYDHQERVTAKEAMTHDYFKPIREDEAKRNAAAKKN